MRILHTADWHLGDRLGRIDRTSDLRRAVERVAEYCSEHKVDVLLIAGDLFSEKARTDTLRTCIEHVQQTFQPFLLGGGTILALTGNHDNENFCQTLRLVMTLAAPASEEKGTLHPSGRLYLATNPTFLRLAGRSGEEVQFILMPYPTPSRYLREEETQRFADIAEKNRRMLEAYARQFKTIIEHPAFERGKPTVLSAHIQVDSAATKVEISPEECIVFADGDLPAAFAYIALGHVHQHQCLRGQTHIRYCGSIERFNVGERDDVKGVVLLDIGHDGLIGEPRFLPLDATPIYEVTLDTPLAEALERERAEEREASRDLVKISIRYTAGKDNLEETLRALDKIFPRWYDRKWDETGSLNGSLVIGGADGTTGFEETVRAYLRQELQNHSEEERDAVLRRAEDLMREVEGS
jgi:exonuclease SbcD